MPAHSLAGKIVWGTGAKRIGQQVARALVAAGARLIISSRSSKHKPEAIARNVARLGSKALLIQFDRSSRESITRASAAADTGAL